jgi:erythromycin esterase
MQHTATKEPGIIEEEAVDAIRHRAYKLPEMRGLSPLWERIGDARIVMLGEASHGTHEYYTWRSYITKKLIQEKGFQFIAVEGDWPDCYRVNRFIKNYPDSGRTAHDVLYQFNRWPTWMWANWEIVALTEWLCNHNKFLGEEEKIGFYGLDVYSLWESMEAIMDYLKRVDPGAMKIAEEAFRCFEPYREEEGQGYARASQLVPELCENEVLDLLQTIRRKMPEYNSDRENALSAEQNALVAVNAEKYYRAMVKGGPHSWNVRDRHMAETLDRLLKFHGPGSKAIVWEHNTHIGDARATDMALEGMFNIGELARLQHKEKGVVLVGFGSYEGSVIAGQRWGETMQKTEVPKARTGSLEYLLNKAGIENKLLITDDFLDDVFLENYLDHRAIGVVYNPQFERYGNYVPTVLPLRYDAFIYINETNALNPLHIQPDGHKVPETFPFGV